MRRKQALSNSVRLPLAAVVAAGLAAAPVVFGPGAAMQANTVAAQNGGYAAERTQERLDPQPVHGDEESVYEILGTTRERAEGAAEQTATAQYGQLETYQAEVERNNLDAAAQVLAVVAERPITEALVTEVNTTLGIETDLTATQIADVAASKQRAMGDRSDASAGSTVIVVTEPGVVVSSESEDPYNYNYDQDTIYGVLGTTREAAEAADTHTMATAQYGQLAAYQTAVERGNLMAAADNLAAIAKRPITEPMVNELNTRLGIETDLTNRQIADAAARIQDEGS